MNLSIRHRLALGVTLAALISAFSLVAQDTQSPAAKPKPTTPTPSGAQTDGAFRKVILDADQLVNGEWQDTVKDPMEMAIAPDGREIGRAHV